MSRPRPLMKRVCIDCGDVAMVRRDGKPRRRCRQCSWVAARAERKGPKPFPRDDLDDVMVDRLVFGERDGLGSIADRLEATRRLTRERLTLDEIAMRMGVSQRSVTRYRRELRRTGRLSHVAVYCATEGQDGEVAA